MTDVNRPKLQLRSGLSINGDKTPSPATKLLLNHGKPNFTIQRLPKAQNSDMKPTSPTPVATYRVHSNSNEFVVKSNTFHGMVKPLNINAATKPTLRQNGNATAKNGSEYEANKVVLRRARVVQTEMSEGKDDENVPEFIRRQRRIQERLANQNILDFENRRSGYFTQVLISPTNPNRQSFVETMASPAVKPGLEIPPPSTQYEEDIKTEPNPKEQQPEVEKNEEILLPEPITFNGNSEEDEVAKAIEEVNKAVEGEDDDKTELEEHATKSFQQEYEQKTESTVVAITTLNHVDVTTPEEDGREELEKADLDKVYAEEVLATPAAVISTAEVTEEQTIPENGHVETTVTSALHIEDNIEKPKSNGLVKEDLIQNGQSNEETLDNGITISHTNGLNGPSLPCPDPKGEKGVNFKPKTVVSFSQELGSDDNKYPDTVKVFKDVQTSEVDSKLNELAKVKFQIKADDEDIEVKPVLIIDTA